MRDFSLSWLLVRQQLVHLGGGFHPFLVVSVVYLVQLPAHERRGKFPCHGLVVDIMLGVVQLLVHSIPRHSHLVRARTTTKIYQRGTVVVRG
jgi:hypothetical protein